MTDLDKKVKEVVERWCLRLPSSQSGSARVEQVDDLIAEVRALYQQDAERREEEAVKFGNKHHKYEPDVVWAAYKSHRVSERSRKGQEGDKT